MVDYAVKFKATLFLWAVRDAVWKVLFTRGAHLRLVFVVPHLQQQADKAS